MKGFILGSIIGLAGAQMLTDHEALKSRDYEQSQGLSPLVTRGTSSPYSLLSAELLHRRSAHTGSDTMAAHLLRRGLFKKGGSSKPPPSSASPNTGQTSGSSRSFGSMFSSGKSKSGAGSSSGSGSEAGRSSSSKTDSNAGGRTLNRMPSSGPPAGNIKEQIAAMKAGKFEDWARNRASHPDIDIRKMGIQAHNGPPPSSGSGRSSNPSSGRPSSSQATRPPRQPSIDPFPTGNLREQQQAVEQGTYRQWADRQVGRTSQIPTVARNNGPRQGTNGIRREDSAMFASGRPDTR